MKRLCRFLAVLLSLVLVLGGVGALPVRAATFPFIAVRIESQPGGTVTGNVVGGHSITYENINIAVNSDLRFSVSNVANGYRFSHWEVNQRRIVGLGAPLSDVHLDTSHPGPIPILIINGLRTEQLSGRYSMQVKAVFDLIDPPDPIPHPTYRDVTVIRHNTTTNTTRRVGVQTHFYPTSTKPGWIFSHWQVDEPSALTTITNGNRIYFTPSTQNIRIREVWTPVLQPVTIANYPRIGINDNTEGTPSGQTPSGVTHTHSPGNVTIDAGTRPGWRFAGWDIRPNVVGNLNTQVVSFPMLNVPVTATAQWVQEGALERYLEIINADATDGSVTVIRLEGSTVFLSASRPGYRFVNWVRVEGALPVVFASSTNPNTTFTMPNGNVTIRANWAPLVSDVSVVNNPAWSNAPAQIARDGVGAIGAYGDLINVIHGNRTLLGFNFSHWTSVPTVERTPGNDNQFRMPAQDVVITFHWTPIPAVARPVVINNRNYVGSTPLTSPSPVNQTYSGLSHFPNAHVTIRAGSIPGYTFRHWRASEYVFNNGNSNVTTSINPEFAMPSGDGEFSVYAYWTRTTSNVDFRHSGIVVQSGGPLPVFTAHMSGQTNDVLTNRLTQVAYGTSIDFWTASRPNYTFVGWEANPSTVRIYNHTDPRRARIDMPDHQVTLTAVWRYDGATYVATIINPAHDESTRTQRHAPGAQVVINAGENPGYTFDRWIARYTPAGNVNDHETGIIANTRSRDTTFTMPAENVWIEALWTQNATPLAAPTNVRVQGTNLTWNAVTNPNAHAYRIYVNGLPRTEPRLVSYHGTSIPVSELNLGPGVHDIQVRALADPAANFTDSALSSPFYRHTIAAPPTPENTRPTGLAISGTTLTWNRVTGADHYFIYVNGVRRSGAVSQPTGTNNPSFNLANLSPRLTLGGTGYDIQVRAIVPVPGAPNIESHLSEVRVFTDNLPPLPTPTNIRIVGNPTLHWDFPTGNHPNLVGFRIYVNGLATQHMVGPNARSFPIANLGLASGTYLLSVRAVGNGIGNSDSAVSTVMQYVSTVLPTLNTPINLNISGHTLTWNAVPGAVGYRIYVNGQPSTAGIVGGLSFNLGQLGLGAGTHLIQVRAIGNNTTHTDSAISAFVSYVLGGQAGNTSNPNTNTPRTANQVVASFNPGAGTLPTGEDGLRMGTSGFVIDSFTNVPTRAGYTFGGWQVGNSGAAVTFPLTIANDMTLNAIWNRVGDAATPTPAAGSGSGSSSNSGSGTRPNPQTGAFGVLNIVGVVVLTGISIFAVKKISGKKDK